VKDNHDISLNTKNNAVTVESVTGKNFKGHMLIVHNPQMSRVVTTSMQGQGEQIPSMVKRTGAITGVNGGAFDDAVKVSNAWNGVDMVHFNSAYQMFASKP